MQRISVVTPVYNEKESLPLFHLQLAEVEQQVSAHGYQFEWVIVDDHSTDETQSIANAITRSPSISQCTYLRLSRNSGSHTAISAGIHACRGDFAVVMAVDLQDPPQLIQQLLNKAEEGFDMVWACRVARKGERLSRIVISNLYYLIMRKFALREMPSQGADFVLVNRKAMEAYKRISEKNTSALAMLMWMGFRQTRIEYVKQPREAGRSKWTLAKKFKLFVDSIVSFSYFPIRFMSCLGMTTALAGLAFAAFIVFGRFWGWVTPNTGYAAVMSVLLIGQGVTMAMLGVLGEYVWRTFDESRGRPLFFVENQLSSGDAEINASDMRLNSSRTTVR